jgi:tetratricopeptide (TPR) repeat protein
VSRSLIALGLVAIALGVFLPARHHDFVNLDDGVYIVRNDHLDEGLTLQTLVDDFTTPRLANWAPLTHLSFHVNHAVHGKQPGGYILTNVALHVLATLLLFLALERMTRRTWPSAFVAAVFAIHPLHVESVVWVSERKSALAGFFWMAGLAAYARYAERPGSACRYASVLSCLTLGLLSKAILVTFPFALLLLDYWPLDRMSRRAVLEKIPMLVLVLAACVLTLWAQRAGGAMAFSDAADIAPGLRLRNAVSSYVAYVFQSAFPVGLTALYPHPREGLPLWRAAAAAAALVLVTAAVVWPGRARRYLAVGWFWYLGTLVPMIGLVQVGTQARADRYMYVPLVGLAIMVAWGVPDVLARKRRHGPLLLAGAGAASIAALALAARVQVGHWRSSETLFERNVAVEPRSFRGHASIALVRVEQERFEEAEFHFEEAFRLWPRDHRAPLVQFHLMMAQRAREGGDDAAAIARYESVLELDPDHARAHGLLGIALVRRGNHARGRPHLERALASGTAGASAHASMAVVLAASGREDEAVRSYRAALRRNPNLDWAANNLAWLLATTQDPDLRAPQDAVRLAEGVVQRADPPNPDQLDTLAAAYAAAGRFPEAVATAQRAVRAARIAGNPALASRVAERLALYGAGRPHREPSHR